MCVMVVKMGGYKALILVNMNSSERVYLKSLIS